MQLEGPWMYAGHTACSGAVGLPPYKAADRSAVSKAYKQKALKVHPDRPGGDNQKFQQLASAYEQLQAWQHPFLSGDAEQHEALRVAQRLCAAAAQLVQETSGAVAVRAELGGETGDAPAAWVRVHALGPAGQPLAIRHMCSSGVLLLELPSGPGWAPTARRCWPTVLALQKLQREASSLPGGPGCLWASEQGMAVLSLQQAVQLHVNGGVPPQLRSPAQLAALGSGQEAQRAAQDGATQPTAKLAQPLLLLGPAPEPACDPSASQQAAVASSSQGGVTLSEDSSAIVVRSEDGPAQEAGNAEGGRPPAGADASEPVQAELLPQSAGQQGQKQQPQQQPSQRQQRKQQGKRQRQRKKGKQRGKAEAQQPVQEEEEEEEEEEQVNAWTRKRRRRRLMDEAHTAPAADEAAAVEEAEGEAAETAAPATAAARLAGAVVAAQAGSTSTLSAQQQRRRQQQQQQEQPCAVVTRGQKRKRGLEGFAEAAADQPAPAATKPALLPAQSAAETALAAAPGPAAATAATAAAAAIAVVAAGDAAATAAPPSRADQLRAAAVPVLQALRTFHTVLHSPDLRRQFCKCESNEAAARAELLQAAMRQLAKWSSARLQGIKPLQLAPEQAASQGLTLRAPVERLAGQLLHSLLPVLVAAGRGPGRQLPAVLDPGGPAEQILLRCCPHAGGNPSCMARHVEGLPGLAVPNGRPGPGAPLRPLPQGVHALDAAQLAHLAWQHLLGIQAAICSGSNPFIPPLRRSDGGRSFASGQYRSTGARDSALAHIERLIAAAAAASAGAPQPAAASCGLHCSTQRLKQLAPLLRQRGCLPEVAASVVACSGQLPCCQGMGEARLVLVGTMTWNTHAVVRTYFKPLCCACWDAKYAVKMAPPAARAGAA
ncbi:hypothetical protein COHA_007368 [Chlorella ohadii]|uniref:J domain-containing protein n=1 Tax=Chlorella ohadii TaxID=2649997 RepID=A0AAD5DM83_9CHLO|nr:hypothetical protein COHA_007368 [Chlorella ohadii]